MLPDTSLFMSKSKDFVINVVNDLEEYKTYYTYHEYCYHHYFNNKYDDYDDMLSCLVNVRSIDKMLTNYRSNGNIDARLLINLIVILFNDFGYRASPHILFYKLCSKNHPYLKTLLSILDFLPNSLKDFVSYFDINRIGYSKELETELLGVLK